MKWELDEFHEANKGLLIGEVELKSESTKFEKPNFIIKEITGQKKYYNSMLQRDPFINWINNS
jgi:adenylate cyclase